MPGSRLTHQDRRLIAAGLAEGLGYAEIARRLERPTSTVTREVTRNGGAHRYRADHAHRATERRARRRTRSPLPAAPAPTDPYGRDPEAVRDFEERFVSLMTLAGLPRMTACVLCRLFTADTGVLTAAELVRLLRVSPASVSKAVGYLEGQGLVRRERVAGRRAERYVIDRDVWFRAWQAGLRVNFALADVARAGAETLGAATPAGARLDDMSAFLRHVSEDQARQGEYWLRFLTARRTREPGGEAAGEPDGAVDGAGDGAADADPGARVPERAAGPERG
ncbi:helix-turn-helix domain-containing protein [Streptomyces sp. URMC 126]|uniref:GbsR/MarR family transcriptional regulator n=1 Tax=Streptomyces sp. URMC 126 TaxID=3423401 RepID=UPI003F1D528F